jgi:hypothetical protein
MTLTTRYIKLYCNLGPSSCTTRGGENGAMVLLPSSPHSTYHCAAPFPGATTSARTRRGSLRVAAAARCSGPAAAPGNSSVHLSTAVATGRRR